MSELLTLEEVTKSFGGVRALQGLTAEVGWNSITGLIGPNGSGKSTLFNVISGFASPDSGRLAFDGKLIAGRRPDVIARMGVRRTFQVPRVARAMTVLENLMLAVEEQPSSSLPRLFSPFHLRSLRREGRAARARATEMAELLGLAHHADMAAGTLSGGQLKLLSIGVSLMGKPRLLLLDEPMAGVNKVLVDRMSEVLMTCHREDGLTVILIEHNLGVVEALCTRVLVLDSGELIADGPAAAVKRDPAVRAAYLGRRKAGG
jgi:branched-chain amino acid transport system ATP-binding protein